MAHHKRRERVQRIVRSITKPQTFFMEHPREIQGQNMWGGHISSQRNLRNQFYLGIRNDNKQLSKGLHFLRHNDGKFIKYKIHACLQRLLESLFNI